MKNTFFCLISVTKPKRRKSLRCPGQLPAECSYLKFRSVNSIWKSSSLVQISVCQRSQVGKADFLASLRLATLHIKGNDRPCDFACLSLKLFLFFMRIFIVSNIAVSISVSHLMLKEYCLEAFDYSQFLTGNGSYFQISTKTTAIRESKY